MDWRELLQGVQAGTTSVDTALEILQSAATRTMGFAQIDLDRHRRLGLSEVVYCPGKTVQQVIEIMTTLNREGQNALATRATPELAAAVKDAHPKAVYHEAARAVALDVKPLPEPCGQVAVVTGGTSDIPVAEEAALIAERMGARVIRIFDVGVAGLHRLMPHLDRLKASRAIVVVAGMEGALPSVVGGLIGRPIVAVPTSVGYGLNLQGATALLAMLNTCVPGITTVNVDNGFGAGVAAAMINRVGEHDAGFAS